MEAFKRICKALLFPHIAVMLVLVPIAASFLIFCMSVLGTETIPSYISYVFAAYVLTVWCLKLPAIIAFVKSVRNGNKFAVMIAENVRLRVNISLLASLIWNIAYSLLQLWLGFTNASFWFYAMAGYYFCLGLMRTFMFGHTRKHSPGEEMKAELARYRACGWIFLGMNLAVALMVFFMIYRNKSFEYDQITTIAMAAYTFTTLTVAIINIVKYRKYNSPVYSASKAISLASACVSMITLTSTMLTTFGGSEDTELRMWMLALLGGAVSAFIIGMAIYMIVQGTKKLKMLNTEVPNEQ